MLIRNIFFECNIKKAANILAAFFILSLGNFVRAKESLETFEDIKKAAGQLLVKKQKSEAIALVNKFLKNENNQKNFVEANEFLIRISQTFLSKEAQDAYEGSVNATLENPKEAQRLVDTCLSVDPDNSDCIIQKIRLSHREKNRYFVEKYLKDLMVIIKTTNTYRWVEDSTQKNIPGSGFKDKTFVKNFSGKLSEDTFVLAVLEIERSFAAKNFSRARSGIEFLEKAFPEYPENSFFKQKLDSDSVEDKVYASTDGGAIYLAKCKSLTKTMVRKFRYDFDLCMRGLQ